MHWLQFGAYFLVALTFFGGVWWGLERWFGAPKPPPIREGRILTQKDFEDLFEEDPPTFLWPLDETKRNRSGHR